MDEIIQLKSNELIQWIKHSEESIFLLDNGFEHLKDLLIPIEDEVTTEQSVECASDGDEIQRLVAKISQICQIQARPFYSPAKYHLQALKGIWMARDQWLREKKGKKNVEEIIYDQVERRRRDETAVESELSLMLIICLLESQSRVDPTLTEITTRLLADHFRSLKPLSLTDASSHLQGLENLLTSWLKTEMLKENPKIELTATALVTLACAYNSHSTLLRTILILKQMESKNIVASLRVREVISELLQLDGGVQDVIKIPEMENLIGIVNFQSRSLTCESKHDKKIRNFGCDGKYLYLSNETGCRFARVGSGHRASVKGYIYATARTEACEPGFMSVANQVLIHRPAAFDNKADSRLCKILNRLDLKESVTVDMLPQMKLEVESNTIRIVSNGVEFFWLRSIKSHKSTMELTHSGYIIILDVFEIDPCTLCVRQTQPRIVLSKLPISSVKIMECISMQKEESSESGSTETPNTTTCGLSIALLSNAAIYVCGNFITFMVSSDTETLLRDKLSQASFSTYVFCTKSGFIRQEGGVIFPKSVINGNGRILATYDTLNHRVWISTSDQLVEFEIQGFQPINYLKKQLGINQFKHTDSKDDLIPMPLVSSCLMHHLGLNASQILSSKKFSESVSYKTDFKPEDLELLRDVLQLLQLGPTSEESTLLSFLSFLRLAASQTSFQNLTSDNEQKLLKEIEEQLWQLSKVDGEQLGQLSKVDGGEKLRHLTLVTLSELLLKVNPERKQKTDLCLSLLEKMDLNFEQSRDLLELLLTHERHFLDFDIPKAAELIQLDTLTKAMIKCLENSGIQIIALVKTCSAEELLQRQLHLPDQSVFLKYVSALVSRVGQMVLGQKETQEESNLSNLLSEYFKAIVESSCILLKTMLEAINSLEEAGHNNIEDMNIRFEYLSLVPKSTILGCLLQTLVVVQTAAAAQQEPQSQVVHLKPIISLMSLCCQLAQKLESTDAINSSFQNMDSVSPWGTCTKVETIHPVSDGYKISETVRIPGAKRLAVYFDRKCSTQNELDKLILSSATCKKIAEFGGNPYGQGNKRMLSGGWPKFPLLVDGDNLILTFEVKSRRDSDTMDKTVWGFRVLVRGCTPSVTVKSPSLFCSLAISLVSLMRSNLCAVYDGAPKTPEENECKTLLQSKLLQRCIWKSHSNLETSDSCLMYFPKQTFKKLKSLGHCKLPMLRSSMKSVICPEMLEEKILTVVIKHMGLSETVSNLALLEQENSPELFILSELVSDVYLKINALIRRLQGLANLEVQWGDEVAKIREGGSELKEVFFQDYLHHESKTKELSLLCFLRGVRINENSQEQKIMQQLKDIIEKEARFSDNRPDRGTTTEAIVKGIFARLDLLLRVEIDTATENGNDNEDNSRHFAVMTRSLQSWPEGVGEFRSFRQQQRDSQVERSMDDSILQIPRLQSRLRILKDHRSVLGDLQRELHQEEPNKLNLLEQLFCFIGYRPEEAVSSRSFLRAVAARRKRSQERIETLKIMRKIITSAGSLGWAFLAPVTDVLSNGLRTEELTCGNLVSEAIHEFSLTLTDVVKIVKDHPEKCFTAIGNLCIIPYNRDEEKCLLQSQIVKLLDQLCEAHDFRFESDETSIARLAWMGFKVLSRRCITWETEEDLAQGLPNRLKCEPISLEHQVSNLLVNHLVKASRSGNCAIGNEVLQEVLTLLGALSKSRLGRGILSQPYCVSKLLSLLNQENLSPKVIMTIIKLINIALPIMTREASNQLSVQSLGNDDVAVESKIVLLLLSKLTDYLVPSSSEESKSIEDDSIDVSDQIERQISVTSEPAENIQTLSLFVHKRRDQSAHEIIQLMLNSASDMDIFPNSSQESMEKVVRMDKEMNKNHRAEVMTNDATVIFRTATRMAQQGFVVSVSTPGKQEDGNNDSIMKICKSRNEAVAKTDPGRPFLSNEVANGLAAELITLFHNLMKSNSAIPWRETIMNNLRFTLKKLGPLTAAAPDLLNGHEDGANINLLYDDAGKIVACLALLGGFTESLKPGSQVHKVSSTQDELTSLATVVTTEEMPLINANCQGQSVAVQVVRKKIAILEKLHLESMRLFMPMTSDIIDALLQVFTSDDQDPLSLPLPTLGPGIVLETSRLVAEIRTRICQLLALYLETPEFCCRFLQSSCEAVDLLKYHSKDCLSADKFCCIESTCLKLRSLYRDSVKPVKSQPTIIQNNDSAAWDVCQSFPPLKSLIFTRDGLGITYLGEPTTVSGLPRGIFVYANNPLTEEDNMFEVEVVSLGESADESGAVALSIGLAPPSERKETWSYPNGSLFLHNNGRAVHYSGPSLLQWRSIRFDSSLNPGDRVIVTLVEDKVIFTLNGTKLDQCFEEVPTGLFPVVHVQKKGVRVKAVFGDRKLTSQTLTAKGSSPVIGGSRAGAGHRRSTHSGRPALRSRNSAKYNHTMSVHYCLASAGQVAKSGNPDLALVEFDDDEDSDEDDEGNDEELRNREDLHSLLVKAWETHVFPAIRRRFRNENERRDGLEQIRGALALGMIEIARQTVEFLYEENGGIPRDLKLPTLDDIKDQMLKLTAEKLKPGQLIAISSGEGLASKFASKPQLRTLGMCGEVVQVDVKNDLVEVETYLKEEGILVSFWYPITCLKKPAESQRRDVKLDNHLHTELLNNEFALSRMFCRKAYCHILKHSRNENLPSLYPVPDDSMMMNMIHSNLLLLREFDHENLTFLLEDNFGQRLCTLVNINESNIDQDHVEEIMNRNSKHILDFFGVNSELIQEEFKLLFEESQVNEQVVDDICNCLSSPSTCFTTEEIVINDVSMLSSVIRFDGAAFVVATCRFEGESQAPPDGMKVQMRSLAPTSPNNSQGHFSQGSIFQWPADSHGGGRDPKSQNLPFLLFASNALKVNHSGGGNTNILIQIDGIPTQFLLAIGFIDQAFTRYAADFLTKELQENILERLITFMIKHQLTPPVKELLFHLFAKILHSTDINITSLIIDSFIEDLMDELDFLYGKEKAKGHKLYSTYLQSLFEISCAWLQRIPTVKDSLEKSFIKTPLAILEGLQSCVNSPKFEIDQKVSELKPTSLVPKSHSRILVISGIPRHLKVDYVLKLIQTVTNRYGGTFADEIFVPVLEEANQLGQNNSGYAVVECRAAKKLEDCKVGLDSIEQFHQHGELDMNSAGTMATLTVSKVDQNLNCLNANGNEAWTQFLQSKLLCEFDESSLSKKALQALTLIFEASTTDFKIPVTNLSDADELSTFLVELLGKNFNEGDKLKELLDLETFKDDQDKSDDPSLSLCSIVKYVAKRALTNPASVMRGFYICGFDLQFHRYRDQPVCLLNWNLDKDSSLVQYADSLSSSLNISSLSLDPSELVLTENVLLEYPLLRDSHLESLQSRFAWIQNINSKISDQLLQLIDFRPGRDELSNASLVSKCRSVIFYDVKSKYLNDVIDATSMTTQDQAAPTVTVNPVESIGESVHDIKGTWFYQSLVQLSTVSSLELCVPLASGADPHYPFLVKMIGENVEGQSGSFRHLLTKLVDELHGNTDLSILMPYLGEGDFKGRYILRPGPVNLVDEQLLQHFGKLLGLGLRSGIPLSLDLAPAFWKTLLEIPLTEIDLKAFDPIVSAYLLKIQRITSESDFNSLLEDLQFPRFVYPSIRGDSCDLVDHGSETYLSWDNRNQYVTSIQEFRLKEMASAERMAFIRAGLATLAPINILVHLFTPAEAELKICGLHRVDLTVLKRYTIYQVGLSPSDQHIQFFWAVLESFDDRQRQRFVKFACNQDRIPIPKDCDNPPAPYPMKLAPSDKRDDPPDNQNIRVETCMFMVKLPRFSTFQKMREKILFAINAAFDPLSG